MIEADIVRSIGELLFSEDETNIFAVLDGASVPDLLMGLYRHQPEYVCLYRGELEPDMAEVAPYLVWVKPESKFTEWALQNGWGNHWGIFAVSSDDLRTMRHHFRTLLTVYNEEGKPLLFRFYDPRVLRVYLPTCNSKELEAVFGPVTSYILEDQESTSALRFRTARGSLKQEVIQLG